MTITEKYLIVIQCAIVAIAVLYFWNDIVTDSTNFAMCVRNTELTSIYKCSWLYEYFK